jgi:hypothetical protein
MTAVPGTRLLAFASRWFDAPTVSRVFEPLVADWQREWIDAASSRRALVRVRGIAAFVCAVAVAAPVVLSIATPATVLRSILLRIALFTTAFSVMLALPMLIELDPLWRETPILMIAIPAAVALALPFAIGAGVDGIRRGHALPPHAERAAALKLGLVGCAVMFVLLGWALPAVSQQWRASMATAESPAPERGLREFTIVELVIDPWLWRPGSLSLDIVGPNAHGREVRRELTQRLSLSLLPALIVWIRWRMIDIPQRRYAPLPISVGAGMMLAGTLLFLGSGDLFEQVLLLPRVSASWGPWAALAIIGMIQAFRDVMPTRSKPS